jgi:holliday junction DNA helicase RuvA
MFAHIEGKLDYKSADKIVVDVGGVGYDLNVPSHLYDLLPAQGQRCKVFVHTHFREEDGMTLYGFITKEDKDFFELLMTVSGIGPKVALGVLSSVTSADLAEAIVLEDIKALTRINGIGKKTAQRLILELKEKVADMRIESHIKKDPASTITVDAEAALVSLGYTRQAAEAAVTKARGSAAGSLPLEELIKLSLRYL